MFDFFKKEKPFQGFNGFGGGAAGLGMFSGKAEITGGTKSTARSGYTVHTFTSSGSLVAPDGCLLYTSPSPRDKRPARMPSSA